jgi:DNA polymerase V
MCLSLTKLKPQNNKIAICFIDGVYRKANEGKDCLYISCQKIQIIHHIKVTEENELIIWGIVTYVSD